MAQFLGFGNGSDGVVTLSGTAAPIDSSCSGTAAATSLSATNASFAANQIILIHQSRGTGVGQWEVNQIASYVAGTITTRFPLTYTYTDSGASQAQVLVIPQYSSVTVSGTYTAKAWDGNVGGILAFMCSGKLTVSGTITATGKGYVGGAAVSPNNQTGKNGEGTSGAGQSQTTSANGSGGGGGSRDVVAFSADGGGGGGGGHASTGTTGENGNSGSNPGGTGGSTSGATDLITMTFGGAGGSGGTDDTLGGPSGAGGNGGGIICVFTGQVEITGSVVANGNAGTQGSNGGGGGGGAGGSVFIKARSYTVGTTKITGVSGGGGAAPGEPGAGGAGSEGRVRLEGCMGSGTTSPSASEQKGGYNFCTVKHGIL